MAKAKPIEYGGMTYASLSALAREKGLRATTLHRRLGLGWTLEQAVGDEPPPPRRKGIRIGKQVEYKGRTYPSTASLADEFGVAAATLAARLKRGWTMEQAVGDAPPPAVLSPTAKRVTFEGKEYESYTELADAYGLKPSVLLTRVREGSPLDVALEQKE